MNMMNTMMRMGAAVQHTLVLYFLLTTIMCFCSSHLNFSYYFHLNVNDVLPTVYCFQVNLNLNNNNNSAIKNKRIVSYLQHSAKGNQFSLSLASSTSPFSYSSAPRLPSPFAIFAQSDTSTDIEFSNSVYDILEVDLMTRTKKNNSISSTNTDTNSACGIHAILSETKCWGTSPLLIRGAFRSQAQLLRTRTGRMDDDYEENNEEDNDDERSTEISSLWPTWDEVMELAFDEDAESRLITHVPGDPLSWKLRIGPFATTDIDNFLSNNDQHNHNYSNCKDEEKDAEKGGDHDGEKWTMVLNDVDRFYPPLFDFITDSFSFIPQWRKDDGQISLSDKGGGIGPHTDDYDVFLIQMAGERRWDIGKRIISNKEELENLYDGLDVRILNFWESEVNGSTSTSTSTSTKGQLVESFVLHPGDVMYVPPRFAHCGTALSDGCMTLSVGLRAPSAKEMMTKMTECIEGMVDGDFVKRYTDPDLFVRNASADAGTLTGAGVDSTLSSSSSSSSSSSLISLNQITNDVKMKSKQLLKDAFLNLLDDDMFFDEFLGKIVTESKRLRTNYPIPLIDLDDSEIEALGIFGNPKLAVEMMMLSGCGEAKAATEVTLYAAEGIAWSYSIVEQEEKQGGTNNTENNKNMNKNPNKYTCCRLFVDGRKWEIGLEEEASTCSSRNDDDDASSRTRTRTRTDSNDTVNYREKIIQLIGIMCTEKVIRGELFARYDPIPEEFMRLLEDLVREGYLYGSSE